MPYTCLTCFKTELRSCISALFPAIAIQRFVNLSSPEFIIFLAKNLFKNKTHLIHCLRTAALLNHFKDQLAEPRPVIKCWLAVCSNKLQSAPCSPCLFPSSSHAADSKCLSPCQLYVLINLTVPPTLCIES